MYRHKFAHLCACLQEHFVLPKCGQELSMNKTSIKQKKMTEYIKKPHTSIFIGQTNILKKNITNILTTSLTSAQHSEKMIPIILKSGSKTMIKFDL